jgi:hypothetical protein
MITKEQYLEAKKIVDEYELAEFEEGQRRAEKSLDEDEDNDNDEDNCAFCGTRTLSFKELHS